MLLLLPLPPPPPPPLWRECGRRVTPKERAACESSKRFTSHYCSDSPESAPDEYVVWDGELSERNVYFSGKSPSLEQTAAIKARGGECFLGALTEKKPMGLLFVKDGSRWADTPKAKYALENNMPVACYNVAVFPGLNML